MSVDWSECEWVESVAGKMGGRPVIKGTRIEPDTTLHDEELGRTPEETHADFPTLSLKTIREVLAFAHKHAIAA